MNNIDIALVLDKIRPSASWRMADTYDNLKATWEDKTQTLPTEDEIKSAWEEMKKGTIVESETVDPNILAFAEALAAQEARLTKLENNTVEGSTTK